MKMFLWNQIVVRALNLVCRAETTTLTSPSGGVSIHMCDGWCQAYRIEAGGHANVGLGSSRFYAALAAYEQHLRTEGYFTEADELLRLQSLAEEN